jgi:hypothetical protein
VSSSSLEVAGDCDRGSGALLPNPAQLEFEGAAAEDLISSDRRRRAVTAARLTRCGAIDLEVAPRGLEFHRQQIVMARGLEPRKFREYWKNNYGPTIAVYRHNADRPDRVSELDAAFLRLLTDWRHDDAYPAEYLLVTAHKATDDD